MKMVKSTFSVTLLSFLLVSCGDDALRNHLQSSDTSLQRSLSNLSFQGLNTSVAGNIAGSGSLRLTGGKLHIEFESDGHSPNSRHIQIVYNKSRCPLDTDDVNGDGIVDYQEAIGTDGELLPLTSELSEEGEYPTADENGKYQYKVSGDSSLSESSLEGRAIIIHGISETVTIPDTVQGAEGLNSHESLPVACAIIEFEEGQDQTTGGTTGETTGGETTTSSSSTGDHEQTTSGSGKGGYQEQTTGGKGKGKGIYQEHTVTDQHQQQQQQQKMKWDGEATTGI